MRAAVSFLLLTLSAGLQAGQSAVQAAPQAQAQTPPAAAAPPPAAPQDSRQVTTVGEIKILAETKERTKDRILCAGNVEIHYKDIALFADRVDIDPEKKDVLAEGHVVLQSPQEVLSAERASFNLDSSRGELVKVFAMLQPSLYYEAASVEKKADNLYALGKGRVTTCAQPVPRWDFSFARADFKKDDYMAMWGMVLAVKKIPVFYLPYFRYPLNRDRATGFLTPQAGFSGTKGFTYSQSFYWAIGRSMDATLTGDYYSSRGMGGGLEYRYLFSEGSGGALNLYYFLFKKDPERTNADNAYILRLNHNQTLPLDFKLVANVDYQSSFDFLREFDNNFQRAVISNRSSQVYLSRDWSNFNLNIRVSRFETYFNELRNSIVSYNLPQVSFSSFKIKVFSPLYFSLGSGLSRWEYGWANAYQAGTQTRAQSFWLVPALSVPFTEIPWLTLNTTAGTNLTYYFQSYAPWGKQVVDEPLLTQNFNLSLELTGPVFYRLYRGADGEPKLKHVIEPSVSYKFDSPVARSDRIITARGYFFRYHQLSFGLTNRIFVKQDGMPREVLTLGVSGIYYLAPEESPLQIYRVNGEIPRFADVGSYLRFYPSKDYSVDFSAGFNPYHKTFSSVRFGANLGVPEDDVYLRLSWYKSINPYFQNAFYNRHQVSAYGGLKIPALDLQAEAEVDYNVQEKKFLYSAFSFVYDYQCLQLKVEARVFYFREKPETQFRISFGLGNIGKSTDILGGIGF
jgi:lipopolysaccharide assembly outer membrane protein LptD (OstA)